MKHKIKSVISSCCRSAKNVSITMRRVGSRANLLLRLSHVHGPRAITERLRIAHRRHSHVFPLAISLGQPRRMPTVRRNCLVLVRWRCLARKGDSPKNSEGKRRRLQKCIACFDLLKIELYNTLENVYNRVKPPRFLNTEHYKRNVHRLLQYSTSEFALDAREFAASSG